MNTLLSFFTRADVANLLFVIFIASVFSFLYVNNSLNNFLTFGPNKEKPAEFIGMKLDDWEKCYVVMAISFMVAIVSSYTGTVMFEKIWRHLEDDALKKSLETSKSTTQLLQFISPLLWKLEEIIEFYLKTTFQLQYMIPDLIGSMIIDLPYDLYKLSKKTFR